MNMKKNYNFVVGFTKLLQPVFNILFYVCIFFIILSFILSVILFFVNVDVEKMFLPPFIHKISDTAAYEVSFGNGIIIVTDIADIVLDDIKAVIFAGIFVIICTFLTVAPVFKFLSMILKNINSKDPEKMLDDKNPRYVMFIGLCVFLGNVLIRFMMRFYNYYLAVRFIKDAHQEIKLSLGLDFFDGITGLVILFIGLIMAYVFQNIKNNT